MIQTANPQGDATTQDSSHSAGSTGHPPKPALTTLHVVHTYRKMARTATKQRRRTSAIPTTHSQDSDNHGAHQPLHCSSSGHLDILSSTCQGSRRRTTNSKHISSLHGQPGHWSTRTPRHPHKQASYHLQRRCKFEAKKFAANQTTCDRWVEATTSD